MEVPWNSMDFHRFPWNSMDFHRFPWISMEFHGGISHGEYCLIRVSVIIVGYVRFRLKLKLGAILETKAILPQKICSGHQNERSALGLCQRKFEKKLFCRLFISCNILIGSVTHVAGKFVTWASFTGSLKL